MNMSNILIAGLGDVATTHLAVLEQIPGVTVVAGVDRRPRPGLTFRGQPVPVYAAPADAARRHDIDTVVIATPTPSHATLCGEVAACLPDARILVEKPAAATLPDATRVLRDIGRRQPVDVAYHMAFSPEVTWAADLAREHARDLGPPVSAQAVFADPYQASFDTASARLANSWIDSGINALSILARFAAPTARTSLRSIGTESQSVFEAHVTCQAAGTSFSTLLLTTWNATDPAKTTRIRYQNSAELVMDHTAVAAWLIQDDCVSRIFGLPGDVPRRERHYRALYSTWLTAHQPIATMNEHLLLHNLLLSSA